jgi:glycosyltransferase involved in cell wall biosynthesis
LEPYRALDHPAELIRDTASCEQGEPTRLIFRMARTYSWIDFVPEVATMRFGRILVVSDYPIGFPSGFGETLFNLFKGFPTENVFCAYPEHLRPVPEKQFGTPIPFKSPLRPSRLPGALNHFYYPWLKLRQRFSSVRVVATLSKLIEQKQISHILAIPVTPWLLAAAVKLCGTSPNVKFSVFVMDDWEGHHSVFKLPYSRYRRDLLAKAIRLADTRFAVSREMAAVYEKEHAFPWDVVHNGCSDADKELQKRPSSDLRSSIVLTGDVNIFRSDAVISFGQALDRYNTQYGTRLLLTIYGDVSSDCRNELQALKSVKLIGRQKQDVCFRAMRDADLLYLPLSFSKKARRIALYSLPTKLPEYLSSGTRILFHAPAESAVCRFANRHGLNPIVSTTDPVLLDSFVKEWAENENLNEDWATRAGAAISAEFDLGSISARFERAFQLSGH